MSIKRDLYEEYKEYDFIGYSVAVYRDTKNNKISFGSRPFEVFLNRAEYKYRRNENWEGSYQPDGEFIFIVVKDVVDENTADQFKVFEPITTIFDNIIPNEVRTPEIHFNADDDRAVEFVKGLSNKGIRCTAY